MPIWRHQQFVSPYRTRAPILPASTVYRSGEHLFVDVLLTDLTLGHQNNFIYMRFMSAFSLLLS